MFLHADGKDSDQTGRMPRLIWVFCGRTGHFVGFVMRRLRYFLCSQGLEVIESTNLKYFTKEMTAEFYALKGMFLAQIGRSDDANKAFSAAVQMHDTLVKAWALWGDYLEQVFTRDK